MSQRIQKHVRCKRLPAIAQRHPVPCLSPSGRRIFSSVSRMAWRAEHAKLCYRQGTAPFPRHQPSEHMMTVAIALQSVTKSFTNVVAVDRLDLTVPSGSLYGFIGPNGSGKTTTLAHDHAHPLAR